MLPSGNDASLVLAIWGGRLIYSTMHLNNTFNTIKTMYSRSTNEFKDY